MTYLFTIGIVTLVISFDVQFVDGNTNVTEMRKQNSTGGLYSTTVQTSRASQELAGTATVSSGHRLGEDNETEWLYQSPSEIHNETNAPILIDTSTEVSRLNSLSQTTVHTVQRTFSETTLDDTNTTMTPKYKNRGPVTDFENRRCPKRFCQHMSYECGVSCGERGADCELSNCRGYYHCSSAYVIPVSEACDGFAQCLDKDDELQCSHSYQLQPNCTCSGLQIKCNASREIIKDLPSFSNLSITLHHNSKSPSSLQLKYITYILITGCGMDIIFVKNPTVLQGLLSLMYIDLSFNKISKLPDYAFSHLPSLNFLNLGYNLISSLPVEVFRGASNLTELGLNRNMISSIPDNVFAGLTRLEILLLDNNMISTLPANVFSDLHRLTLLSLIDNKITTLHNNLFSALSRLSEMYLQHDTISTLPANVFSALSRLTGLYLHGNHISVLHAKAFNGLSSLKYLTLGNNMIPVLPVGVFNGLTRLVDLHLNRNNMTNLPENGFRDLTSLEYLSVEYNLISYIPLNAFSGLPRLQILALDNNMIRNFHAGVFRSLNQLQRLSVVHNSISNLDANVFYGLYSLAHLSLWKNIISFLPVDVFIGLSRLEHLALDNNQINNLHRKVFRGLYNMEYLDLSNNMISELPFNAFNYLPGLTHLFLSNNTIAVLHADIFNNLSRLEILDLNENKITNLQSDVFRGLYNLKSLQLNNNLILNIPANVFNDLSGLKYLYLSNNTISTLPVHVFDALSRLNDLDLDKNNITHLHYDVFEGLYNLEYLYLNYNSITNLPENVFTDLLALGYLGLSRNCISNVSDSVFSGLNKLRYLNIRRNKISTLPAHIFNDLTKLNRLDLHYNDISSLPSNIFGRLLDVEVILISHNNLLLLPSGLFINNTNLRILSVYGNDILVQERMLHGLDSLEYLMTDSELVCCTKPTSITKCLYSDVYACTFQENSQHNSCTANAIKPIPSCLKLVYSDALTACLWIIGLFTLFGNGFATCYRSCIDRENIKKAHSVFLINLSISDFLTSVFMIIIGSANAYYNGIYAWNSQIWRSSSLCATAGILAMASSEMSTFLISMITIDRFIAIVFPFSSRRITWRQAIYICCSLWVLSVAIALIPKFVQQSYFNGEFYSQSGVCLGLPLASEQQPGVEYSLSIFVGLNGVVFVFLVFAQICIYRSMKQSGQVSSTANNKRDNAVARILIAVVITDLLSWGPIAVMGLMVWLGEQFPPTVYAWVMVLVIPVNAVINPILYTGTYIWRQRETEKKRKEILQQQK